MTDTPSADDLQRENDRLRTENNELRDGLRVMIRRQAATEAGLEPALADRVTGDDFDEARADAERLAGLVEQVRFGATPPPAASLEADAIQQHLRERQDDAAALNQNHTTQED